jgi:hypothetical protein
MIRAIGKKFSGRQSDILVPPPFLNHPTSFPMKALLLTLCALVIGAGSSAYAQCPDQLCLPDGTPVNCIIDPSGTKVWVDLLGNPIPGQTSGDANFVTIQCDCPNSTLFLAPTSFQATSTHPVFGTITTTLDGSRPTTPATVIANPDGTYTETFFFQVIAIVPGFPPLKGRQELQFVSPGVRTFPHVGERFTQAAPVEFELPDGCVLFTLSNTQVTLN